MGLYDRNFTMTLNLLRGSKSQYRGHCCGSSQEIDIYKCHRSVALFFLENRAISGVRFHIVFQEQTFFKTMVGFSVDKTKVIALFNMFDSDKRHVLTRLVPQQQFLLALFDNFA